MKLSVSYNGDLNLIESIKDFKSVAHIFGASSKLVTGNGRNPHGFPTVSGQDIVDVIKHAHNYGIEFNYLMNSSCMGNQEFTDSKFKEIIKHLEWVEEIGADWVTIANPYLVEVCKRRFPKLKISLSSFAMVESIERAKYFEDMGVDEITVRENINRNFRLLENIRERVRCDIQLLVNQTCLFQCPYQFYHDNVMSHSSQHDDVLAKSFIDYSIIKCTYKKFKNPEEMIKICWVRPEDLKVYEDIGINKFKITDRSKSTQWLTKVVKAYENRKFDGNLADILNLVIVDNIRHNEDALSNDNRKTNDYNAMNKFVKAFLLLSVFIDNNKLDGFIDHFKSSKCGQVSCGECNYCNKISKKVISFPNEKSVTRALDEIDRLLNEVINR